VLFSISSPEVGLSSRRITSASISDANGRGADDTPADFGGSVRGSRSPLKSPAAGGNSTGGSWVAGAGGGMGRNSLGAAAKGSVRIGSGCEMHTTMLNADGNAIPSSSATPSSDPPSKKGSWHPTEPLSFCGAISLLCNCNVFRSCRHSSSRYTTFLDENPLPVLGGVAERERAHLARLDSEARVNALFAQVLGMISARRASGGLAVDAPVLSRIHQELSAGMEGFQQACKLEDTPFPFPYAQVISVSLAVFALSYPLVAASKASGSSYTANGHTLEVEAFWLAPLITFFTVMTYFAFHEVARELEDPFLHPPNQLPLGALQTSFNTRLTTSWEALELMYEDRTATYQESEAKLHVQAGLYGVNATNASALLADWGSRPDILPPQRHHAASTAEASCMPDYGAVAAQTLQLFPTVEEATMRDDVEAVEGEAAPGTAQQKPPSMPSRRPRAKRVSLTANPRRITRSAAFLRNSVAAKRISVQLVNVT